MLPMIFVVTHSFLLYIFPDSSSWEKFLLPSLGWYFDAKVCPLWSCSLSMVSMTFGVLRSWDSSKDNTLIFHSSLQTQVQSKWAKEPAMQWSLLVSFHFFWNIKYSLMTFSILFIAKLMLYPAITQGSRLTRWDISNPWIGLASRSVEEEMIWLWNGWGWFEDPWDVCALIYKWYLPSSPTVFSHNIYSRNQGQEFLSLTPYHPPSLLFSLPSFFSW